MKIYLAARYSRHDEMQGVRDVLRVLGHAVTSRWIDCHTDIVGEHGVSCTPEQLNEDTANCAMLAMHDLSDIDDADTMISFTAEQDGTKGGRHVEFGIGLAMGKRMILVGPRQHVFHTLPEVEHYPSWWGLAYALAGERDAMDALL